MEEGALSAGHARALLTLSPQEQEAAARAVISGGLSVRQTEALARRLAAEKKEKKKLPSPTRWITPPKRRSSSPADWAAV